MDIIAARVRSLREYKDWSQEDLANASGLKRPHISLIETKERMPGADTLVKLARALNVSTDYLLGLTDNPSVIPFANSPLQKDPIFARLVECYRIASPELRRAITDAFALSVGLEPTRPFVPNPPPEE